MQSGFVGTTLENCDDDLCLVVGAWDYAHHHLGESAPNIFTNAYISVYGDDMNVAHSSELFNNFVVRDFSAKLGHIHGPATKTGELTADTPNSAAYQLKRLPYVEPNGLTHFVLDPDTLTHIHAFIRGKDKDYREATTINADASLLEFSKLGPKVFTEVKEIFDRDLLALGCRATSTTYAQCHKAWLEAHGVTTTSFASYTAFLNTSKNLTDQSLIQLPGVSRETMGNDETTRRANPQSEAKADPVSGVKTTTSLSTTVTESSISISNITALANPIPNGLNPFKPLGGEKMLERQYPIYEGIWVVGDNPLTRYTSLQFPDIMFTIPNIAAKLASVAFMEQNIEIQVSVGGSRFASGALLLSWIPAAGPTTLNDWRAHPLLAQNSRSWWIDASATDAVKFQLPKASNYLFMRVEDKMPKAFNGMLNIDVFAELSFGAASPPANIPYTLSASLVDVQTAGADINDAPSFAAPGIRVFNASTKIVKQATAEAASKASSNVLVDAMGSVTSIIKALGPITELALFDKPVENATTVPTRHEIASDLAHTRGIMQAPFLAANPQAYVQKGNSLMGESCPTPRWDEILGIPGIIARVVIPANVAAGDVIWGTFLSPTTCFEVSEDVWMPTPLAYFAMVHTHWHGDLKLSYIFISQTMQTASFRLIHYPTNRSIGVDNDKVGDVRAVGFDIAGSTVANWQAEFLSERAAHAVGTPIAAEDSACGSVVIQCVRPIRSGSEGTNTPITLIIYQAAAPGLVLSGQTSIPAAWSVSSLPTFAGAAERSLRGRPVKQSCVRDLFGSKFSTITPSESKTHYGFCDPDRTDGPLDMLRRYSNTTMTGYTTPFNFSAAPNGPFLFFMTQPWVFWSGSISYKAFMLGDAFPGVGCIVVTRVSTSPPPISNSAILDAANGITMTDLSKQPIIAFTAPFQYPYVAANHEGDDVNTSSIKYCFQYRGPSTNPALMVLEAAGDDFALYHFAACPFLVYTPGGSKGKKPYTGPTSSTYISDHVTTAKK
jgi:hypothetical protein